jgi:predicted nucleotidyltransferase
MGRKCLTREEITHFLQNHKKEMKRRFGVESIGLFGSYARGEACEDSDIDIIVMLNSEQLADDYFGVLHYLEDRLQHKIDLGLESNLRPEIRSRIKDEIIYV